jgi:dihydroorotate dehydrogenase electron transfer subunit
MAASVIENRRLAGESHLLRIEDPEARAGSPRSRPGQFALLLASPSRHLIRRPMSVHDEGDGWRSFMVKPVGPASRELAALQPGDFVECSPSFGNGFPAPEALASSSLLLVGGGFGIAPLHFLARRLDALPRTPAYRILYGGRSARDVELDALTGIGGEVLPSTDDGSLGFHGTCVDLCVDVLRREGVDGKGGTGSRWIVLTCGPHAMMEALFEAVDPLVQRVYVSLEEVMACGVGVCMGCVARTREGYVPICTQGPVFEGGQVFGLEMDHV